VIFKDEGRIPQAMAAFNRAMELKPNVVVESNCLYVSHFLPDFDPRALAGRHFHWDDISGITAGADAFTNDRSPERPLRVGIVSGDLRFHSVAFFIYPFLKLHDPRRVRIACYVTSARNDTITASLRQSVEGWQNILGRSDEQVEQLIRRDAIDVLVDLGGHTSGGRLTLFAHKPAPVQVTYLGYPNTTGLKTMDWRITDAIADPPGAEALHSEKLLRLPHSAWCFYPLSGSPPVKAPPSIGNGYITFASFNDLAKINPPLLRTWAKILGQVENSRLILKNRGLSADSVRASFQEILVECGIDPQRVQFLPHLRKPSDHLMSYHDVDIALDTFPYHGTTTTCESLWMGVPVVTRAGATHVSRVGVSLLTTIGLGELIAADEGEFIEIAVSLARDAGRLKGLRESLRQRMQSSKLMDASAMAREMEAACRTMWHNWVEKR
jgi:protein O-GlcNAc transferase